MALDVLKESQNRVTSMSMIHEKLYQSRDFMHVEIGEYIEKLVNDLLYSYAIPKGQIVPQIEYDDIELNIETSIPCGLIISELVSNSFKYAFPDGKTGKITVSLRNHGDGYLLIVGDDGVGLPEDLEFTRTDSLGLELVNNLVDQVDGTIELDKRCGTKFIIKFRELEYKKRI
ncbi:MAG: ATP-binding protein [Methanobacterium sp. ERen5]|nr:MAG: ATP-binding protein [Methanobacterium sp. ERen5]